MTYYLSMLVFGKYIGQTSYILCQLLVCSGKSQLSNYANANYLRISIWTWLMSYHVKATLCHDITTYDISWQPYNTFIIVICVDYYYI